MRGFLRRQLGQLAPEQPPDRDQALAAAICSLKTDRIAQMRVRAEAFGLAVFEVDRVWRAGLTLPQVFAMARGDKPPWPFNAKASR